MEISGYVIELRKLDHSSNMKATIKPLTHNSGVERQLTVQYPPGLADAMLEAFQGQHWCKFQIDDSLMAREVVYRDYSRS